MSPRRRFGDTLIACHLLLLAACTATETSAPLADGARSLGALQLESVGPLPALLQERALSGTVGWSPPIDQIYPRLFVPTDAIDVADTVRAGVPVAITVNTVGENGCWVADGGTLTQSGDSVLIAAYDRHSGAPACTQLWTDQLRHTFSATFPRAGTGVIRAFGRRLRVGTPKYSMPVVATRTVVVLP
jgi:hypothetical protein